MTAVSERNDVGATRQRAIEAQRLKNEPAEQARPQAAPEGERRPVDPAARRAAREGAVASEQGQLARRQQPPSGGPRTARGLSSAPPTARTTPLRVGARGPEVEALQRTLNERGAALQVDGRFGPRTQQAVRDYQQANPPLARDGIVGSRTRASLARPASETKPIQQGSPAAPTGPIDATNPRSMSTQQAAQFLLKSPNVKFWNGLSTGSDRKNIERLANGEQALSNATGQRVNVNPRMMQALVAMAKEGPIQINALTGGVHSHGSRHYAGNAVDLDTHTGNTRRQVEIARQFGGRRNHETTHAHISF